MESAKIKVLLVEDDPSAQTEFERMVQRENLPYDCAIAASVAEVRQALAREKFDIVITDHTLGDGAGFDVLSLAAGTPVIFIADAGNQDMLAQAIQAGAADCLDKDIYFGYLKALPGAIRNTIRYVLQREQVALLQQQLRDTNKHLDYIVRHFVPTNVAERLVTQTELPHLGGQRRIVSVLFADVRGYTSLAEALAPEVVMNWLNRNFAIMSKLIAEYGGTITHYAGDQIMAIFNAPDEQPDHAIRAVRAALKIQAALLSINRRAPDEHGPSVVQVGIGINTGPAVAGYLGFEDRFDYTVIGDTTNVAARLSSAAHSSEVLLGPQTLQAVRGHVYTREVGLMRLKGKSEPVMVYEALKV